MMGKKGGVEASMDIGQMIVRLLSLTFITLAITMFIRHFMIVNFDIQGVEASVLANRFVFSPDCISYRDDSTDRSYSGIIDLHNFNSKVLDECIYFGEKNKFAAANLTLRFLDTGKNESILYNPDGYILLLPRAGFEGAGGTYYHKESRYVLVQDSQKLRNAVLDIEVLIPN
ncbi:hypothetical protein KY320_01930 [Candidatus Woesearchaeota archaeon]|nr:hypothetical protein [Candidatus Woesearchaeota archaeon]